MDEQKTTAACASCGGTGFALAERNGQKVARLCACRKRAAAPPSAEQALDRARVPRRFWNCDFEHFFDHSMDLVGAKKMALRYAEEYPLEDQGLLLMGSPGVGKTHLAVAILRRVATEKGVSGLFIDAQDLLRRLQATFERSSGPGEDEVLEPVLTCDLLVLDDLGGRLPTPWVEDTLLHIVTTRYNERRPMIITTNYFDGPPDGGVRSPSPAAAPAKKDAEARALTLTDRIGPRMRSRLYEMCRAVVIVADDFRVRVKHEGHPWTSQRLGRPQGDA